jgi:hypothetical protein
VLDSTSPNDERDLLGRGARDVDQVEDARELGRFRGGVAGERVGANRAG